MTAPSTCPHCGSLIPTSPEVEPSSLVFASLPSQTIETLLPATFCGDEARSDHPSPQVANESILPDRPILRDSSEFSINGSGEFDPLASPVADPLLDVFASADPDAMHAVVSPPIPPPIPSESVEEEAGPSWSFVILASYASAMTIAVAWLLWQAKGRTTTPLDTLPKPGRVDREKDALNVKPIAAAYHVGIGKTLAVGSLEFTPLSFTLGTIWQEFLGVDGERTRADSPPSLILKVRLKNVSKNDSFAPLDMAFLRESDSAKAESFLEVAGSRIESYPLAVASERSIVGQTFPLLKPGESAETLLATEPSTRDAMSSAGTWRIPLRIAPDRKVTIGVDLAPEDLH
jgi:hypothetical protein